MQTTAGYFYPLPASDPVTFHAVEELARRAAAQWERRNPDVPATHVFVPPAVREKIGPDIAEIDGLPIATVTTFRNLGIGVGVVAASEKLA